MKLNLLIAGMLSGIFLIFSCAEDKKKDDNSPTGPDATRSEVVGAWNGDMVVALPAYGIDINLSFHMTLRDTDSSYLLYVQDNKTPAHDTLFRHLGKWTFAQDTVNFYGDTCFKDSTGTLVTYACEPVIRVTADIRDDGAWYVKIEDMEEAVLAVGTDPQQYQAVKSSYLKMTK